MTFVDVINTILCAAIVVLGSWGYKKDGNKTSLAIGISFGLFGISHIITLLGYGQSLIELVVTIRIIAYLNIVFSQVLVFLHSE